MGTQKKVLSKVETIAVSDSKNLLASRGVLALGKPGDIITRAYGPVVRSAMLAADADFGTYVADKGILVNSGDCAGVGYKFDTVKGLKKGQVGSFLVSGACVVEGKAVQAIANAMVVQYLDEDYAKGESHTADTDVYVIEVNGFDTEVKPSSAQA